MLFRAEVWRCAACAQRRARISRAIGGKRLRPLQVPRRATSPPAALAASQFPQTIRGELARQTGLAFLDDSRSWVPQLLEDAPQESLDNRVSSNPGTTQTPGSLTTTQNYSLDLQSIFVLGDQFVRGSNAPTMALPDATDFQKAYPLETDIQNLFVDDADDVMADGTATLSITGRQALSTIT